MNEYKWILICWGSKSTKKKKTEINGIGNLGIARCCFSMFIGNKKKSKKIENKYKNQ